MSDLISRQAAIDALVAETIYTEEELKEYYKANSHRNEWVNGIHEAVEVIKQLPPAHGTNLTEVGTKIEPLTDQEQRIFLAAMERERKVCKEVDDQYTHEPYEVLLTKVCDEIERKVKGALWT